MPFPRTKCREMGSGSGYLPAPVAGGLWQPLVLPEVWVDPAEVQVWYAWAGASDEAGTSRAIGATARRLEMVLSSEERDRAKRFATAELRHSYVARRGLLRLLLGEYLGADPQALRFGYGGCGKPFLAEPFAASGLRFNLSHSGGLVVLAVSRSRELGVDIERLRPQTDVDQTLRRYFSRRERSAILGCPRPERERLFYTGWTRKEAYLKASGQGLSFSPERVEVSVLPGEAPRLIEVAGCPGEPFRWSLVHLEPSLGYVGALALAGDITIANRLDSR